MTESGARSPGSSPGEVILLHGLGANSWWMVLLARRLQAQGYRVYNWGYWSVGQSMRRLIPRFSRRFEEIQAGLPAGVPLHVVGHSMGSIIARGVICGTELPSLQRLVMLSPPNAGSHVARAVGRHLRWLSPLVEELSDHAESLVNCLPLPQDVEIGVIAAAGDSVVKEASTHLPGERDHIVVPGRHSGLLFSRQVAEQIIHFLQQGEFRRMENDILSSLNPAPTQGVPGALSGSPASDA